MDKKLEKAGHQKILRKLAKCLKDLGYSQCKSSFFCRKKDLFIQLIHLHKFSFAPEFRIHFGIKLNEDKDENLYLNGISSHSYQCKDSPNGKKYNFSYHDTDETLDRCVENLFQFCKEVGEEWFNDWNDMDKLLKSSESPLNNISQGGCSER